MEATINGRTFRVRVNATTKAVEIEVPVGPLDEATGERTLVWRQEGEARYLLAFLNLDLRLTLDGLLDGLVEAFGLDRDTAASIMRALLREPDKSALVRD